MTSPAPEYVEREGKVFQFGDYPDKQFGLTPKQYLAANPNLGAGVPIDLQHFRKAHPLTGKLGNVVSTEVRGDSLFARVRWPKALDELLGDDRKVSCHFRPDKTLKQIDLVVNPRIKDAFLFGEIPEEAAPDPEAVEAPEVEFGSGMGDHAPNEHSKMVAQDMHDIAASCYPGLCYGTAMFASDGMAKRQMALIHKKSLNHGAACSRMPAFSEDTAMAETNDKDITLSADVVALRAAQAAQADEIARLRTENEANRAENVRLRNAGILKDAYVFAESIIRPGPDQKAKPAERPFLVKQYVQAALDDASSPRDVTFSVGDGDNAITFGATRLGDFLAAQSARAPLGLGVARSLDGSVIAPTNLPEGFHVFSGEDHAEPSALTDADKARLERMAREA